MIIAKLLLSVNALLRALLLTPQKMKMRDSLLSNLTLDTYGSVCLLSYSSLDQRTHKKIMIEE